MKRFKKGGNKTAQPLNLTPGAKVNVPRNSFDMSYHTLFTSPAGMLLPNYVQDVNYGDYLRLDASNFTRTMPVNTAAFCRFKEVTDFYFVPYRLLWRWYDTFITNVDDVQTSYSPANSRTGNGKIPVIKAKDIAVHLLNSDGTFGDMFNFNNAYNFERLLDLLGYPVSNDGKFDQTRLLYTKFDETEFNPFRLLAYQLLYNNYYRNTDFETNQPESFNIDHLANGAHIDLTKPNMTDIGQVRYVQWRKDRLTSIKPSPLSPLIAGFKPNKIDGLLNAPGYTVDGSQTAYYKKVDESTNEVNVSAQGLRGLMALDRVARLTMLTPKKYDDQIKARYGVNIPNCDYCEARYLGTFDSSLNIGEVTATASGSDGSSTNVLGELAGKGISAGRSNRSITAKFDEAGIVMGMHYILPNAEYDSSRTDDFNRKLLRNDYYMPEYDDLGLQPLQGYSIPQNVSPNGLVYQTQVLGYQSRYSEYKSRIDEIHGQFQSRAPLSFWTTARNASNAASFSSKNLHVNPKITDSLFALKYDGKQTSDPFLCHFKFNATLVRNMSVIGVPQL